MIKVSIIVPVYNVEQYLRKCLDSLINQTLKDIEIICINDGSTDNSRVILQEYAMKDNRIKVRSQENAGVSNARNNGLKIAKGEYIGFCDSDDWIEANFYEKLYNSATKYNADIAATNIIKVRKNKFRKFLSFNSTGIYEDFKEKLEICDIPDYSYIMNKIYKTLPLKESKLLFEEGRTYEDMIFSVQILLYLKRLVTVPDTNYYYLSRNNSIVHTRENDRDSESAMKFVKDFLKSHNLPVNYMLTTTKTIKFFKLFQIKIKTRGKNFKIRINKGW